MNTSYSDWKGCLDKNLKGRVLSFEAVQHLFGSIYWYVLELGIFSELPLV